MAGAIVEGTGEGWRRDWRSSGRGCIVVGGGKKCRREQRREGRDSLTWGEGVSSLGAWGEKILPVVRPLCLMLSPLRRSREEKSSGTMRQESNDRMVRIEASQGPLEDGVLVGILDTSSLLVDLAEGKDAKVGGKGTHRGHGPVASIGAVPPDPDLKEL